MAPDFEKTGSLSFGFPLPSTTAQNCLDVAMLSQLRRTIALSNDIMSLLGAPSHPRPVVDPQASAFVQALVAAGIRKSRHRGLPEALMTELHKIAQASFQKACYALLDSPSAQTFARLRQVGIDLQSTYARLYERKVAEVATILARASRVRLTEKQPYANDVLLYAYAQSPSPTKHEREVLASLTGLTLEQVRVWFQNRRQRMKKRAPELQPRNTALKLEDLIARVAAITRQSADRDEEFDDNDSGYHSGPDYDTSASSPNSLFPSAPVTLTVPSMGPRSFPAPYIRQALSSEFSCEPPTFHRTAAVIPPMHAEPMRIAELTHEMSRLTLRHRRQTPRSSTGSTASAVSVATNKASQKVKKPAASSSKPTQSTGDAPARKKAARKDTETGRKVAGRRTAPASAPSAAIASLAASSSSHPETDATTPRKRLGPLRRKPAGKALARQASGSSVASTSSSDSSRSTSYSSDFSLASDSSFTFVESAPTAASMDCFQPQQFDPLAAFDFTQLFSSQPSDPLPQPVADFELPPELLAGVQMPMDTAAFPPPESTDFLALLNDPTIQDLLQSVQDMDVFAPQQAEQSFTFNNTLDVGSVDTSAFLDLSASTLPTFDAMFGLDASSFQDTLWNSPGFSLPITV